MHNNAHSPREPTRQSKQQVAVFNQCVLLSSFSTQGLYFLTLPSSHLTVWPLPGDTGTRRQCSVVSSHPSPPPTAFRHPEWLKSASRFKYHTADFDHMTVCDLHRDYRWHFFWY